MSNNLAHAQVQRVTLNAREAAQYIGVSYDMLLITAKRKVIPNFQVGRQYFFRQDTLDKWMNNLEGIDPAPNLSGESHKEKIRKLKG